MIKAILFFLFVCCTVFGIGYFGINSTREQKYSAMKVLLVSGVCATLALGVVTVFVVVF